MAWLQNLTGQAEKILNKIDQETANILNDTNLKPKPKCQELEDVEVVTISHNSQICETPANNSYANYTTIHPTKIIPEEASVEEDEEQLDEINPKELESSGRQTPSCVQTCTSTPSGSESIIDDTKNASSSSKSESSLHSFSSVDDSQKYLERISKLEFENEDMSKQLLNIQHLYSEMKNENSILRSNLERANELVNSTESEMEQYKARAHRILQEKEKMICLKAESRIQDESEDNVYINYNVELKKEVKFQQRKNEEFKRKISNLTSELMSLQQQYVVMQNMLQQTNQKTEATLSNERRMMLALDEELKIKSQELSQSRLELSQINQDLMLKSQELDQLRLQVKKHSSLQSNEELQHRIEHLTQTLMVKQNKEETITAERNALRIQLEKLENEYHKNLSLMRNSQQKVIHVNDTDDVKLQIPPLMRISPSDAGVTRKVKHAYTSLDALSIRTGVFLRRYPSVRVFVFSYMVLLHFWVLIILLNYAPNAK